MTFEKKLVALRKEKGLSQLPLAEQLNVSRQAISRWESGAAMPTVDNLVYLSRLYGVSLDALLDTGFEPTLPNAQDAAMTPEQEDDSVHSAINVRSCRRIKVMTIAAGIAALLLAVMIVVLMWIPLTTHGELQNQDGIPMVPIEDLEGKPVVPTERFSLNW